MTRRSTVFFAIIGLFLFTAHQAAAQTTNTITFDTGMPKSPGGGKINGTGIYTLATGSTYIRIELYAMLASGAGQGGYILTTVDEPTKSFNGLITALPAGDYNVFARLTVTTGGGTRLYFDSPVTLKLTVGAP